MSLFRCVSRVVRLCWQGCFILPGYGPHPGNEFVTMIVAAGGYGGLHSGGWRGALIGAGFMALFFLPIYLIGAYDRANAYNKQIQKEGAE